MTYCAMSYAERCDHCGKRYVNIRAHRVKCGPRGTQSFNDPRLSPSENKACELLFNGYSREEIADEMDITREEVRRFLCSARQKGVDVPHAKTGAPAREVVPVEYLVYLRDMFRANGITRGVYRIIGERVGMNACAVKVRIWKHEHKAERVA